MNVQMHDAPKTRQIRSKPRGIEVTVPFFCPPARIPARICLSDITMPTLRKIPSYITGLSGFSVERNLQMRAGMRAGGQKNGTVTSMPRGFERICLVLGASCIWTFIVVPARIYGGSDPVRPSAARLPEQCFPECGAFLGPMGQAGAGWLPSDARPVCSGD